MILDREKLQDGAKAAMKAVVEALRQEMGDIGEQAAQDAQVIATHGARLVADAVDGKIGNSEFEDGLEALRLAARSLGASVAGRGRIAAERAASTAVSAVFRTLLNMAAPA